jgi:hypothetical protein
MHIKSVKGLAPVNAIADKSGMLMNVTLFAQSMGFHWAKVLFQRALYDELMLADGKDETVRLFYILHELDNSIETKSQMLPEARHNGTEIFPVYVLHGLFSRVFSWWPRRKTILMVIYSTPPEGGLPEALIIKSK